MQSQKKSGKKSYSLTMSDDYGDPNDIFFCNIEQILVINHKSLDAYDRRKKNSFRSWSKSMLRITLKKNLYYSATKPNLGPKKYTILKKIHGKWI